MPVYLCKIRGSSTKDRLVRARSQSQAAKHLVEAESITAEQMADAIGRGLVLETASVAEAEPETEVRDEGGEKE